MLLPRIKTKSFGLIIIFLLLSINFSAAQLNLEYTEQPTSKEYEIKSSEKIEITITNTGSEEKNILLIRDLNYGIGEEPIEKNGWEIKYYSDPIAKQPYLQKQITLDPNKEVHLDLEIKYNIMPANGIAKISGTTLTDLETGESIKLEDYYIQLECNKDNFCDQKIHENHQNCPSDCQSGEKDSWCDGKKDKKCDPDCLDYLDPDCKAGEGNQNLNSLGTKNKEIVDKEIIKNAPPKKNIIENFIFWFKYLLTSK
jgi:hypothetical protein